MSYFRAENLSLHFGGLKAVDAVNFAVEKGEILSIIGPNGAGKSSIFNLISRIYSPTSGRIYFEDQDITQQPAFDIAKLGIARTFQNIELFENATVLSNLLVGRHRHSTTRLWQELLFMPGVRSAEKVHRRRVEQVIEFLDLAPYRDKLISGLPYGVRKVIELARALCTEPKLILLDEPSSGLNVEETDDMSFWIRDMKTELGITVGAASKLVDRLERDGLATRSAHPDDRRSSLITLTAAGEAALDQGTTIVVRALDDHLGDEPAAAAVTTILEHLLTTLEPVPAATR